MFIISDTHSKRAVHSEWHHATCAAEQVVEDAYCDSVVSNKSNNVFISVYRRTSDALEILIATLMPKSVSLVN